LRFDELAGEFAARSRRGERPSLEEYIERCPEFADDIRALFPTLVAVERAEPEPGSEDARTATAAPRLARVSDYKVLREIGRGGMGVVYEAEQVSLGRRVALKVLLRSVAGDTRTLLRFRREARAAASLHHTNIVPVFEVGQDEDIVFYAMQFVAGRGLDVVIEELHRNGDDPRESIAAAVPLPAPASGTGDETIELEPAYPATAVIAAPEPVRTPSRLAAPPGEPPFSVVESLGQGLAFLRSAASIGLQAAQGLAYAHARGIQHRDIKPSNLLLDNTGIVWITDFGLAKAGDDGLTQSGDILGTIRYMAPERFRGAGDARADIYALGLTLYELLALRPAFDSSDRLKLIDQIKTAAPVRLRALDPRIPRDLETIVLKAIDKDPDRRYPTADALAEDLRRFLNDEPILARRSSASERVWRWCRRRPGLVVTTATLLVVLAVGAIIAAVRINAERIRADAKAKDELAARKRADAERLRADATAQEALAARKTAEENLQRLYIENGTNAIGRVGYGSALLWYERAWEADRIDPRREALHRQRLAVTLGLCPQLVGLCAHKSPVLNAQFDRASRRVLTRTMEAQAYLWDPWSARLVTPPLRHDDQVLHAEFSPDGSRVATCSADRTARVWDAGTGAAVGPPLVHPHVVHWAAFSSDGGTLATACADGRVRFWDLQSGRPRAQTIACAAQALCVVFHPEGKLVLTADASHHARLWDVATAAPLSGPIPHRMAPGNPLDNLELPPAFSRDGRRILTARDTSVFLGDLQGRTVTTHARDLRLVINRVEFDAQAGRILVVGMTMAALVLDANDPSLRTLQTLYHARQVQQGAFHPDGRIVTASSSGAVHVWNREGNGELIPPLRYFDGNTQRLQLSPDGRHLLAASLDGSARVWEISGGPFRPQEYGLSCGRANMLSPVPFGPAQRAAFSPDGERAVVINDAGPARVLIGADMTSTGGTSLDPGEPVRFALFSGDGRRILTAGTGQIRVWDADSGKAAGPPIVLERPLLITQTASMISTVVAPHHLVLQLSEDGRRVAAVDESHEVRVYDMATGRVLFGPITPLTSEMPSADVLESTDRLPAHRRLGGCLLSADGRQLAIVCNFGRGGVVHVHQVDTGRSLPLPSPHGFPLYISFSNDGRKLLVASSDTMVRTWDTQTGRAIGPPLHQRYVPSLAAFSDDGRRVALYGGDGTLSVWDWESGDLLVPSFPTGTGAIECIWFSRDGRYIVGQTRSGALSQWDSPGLAGSRAEVADLIHLLTASENDARGGIERLSRSALRDDPERFRRAWLAWRSAIEARSTAGPQSGTRAGQWNLARMESERLKNQAHARGIQGTLPAVLRYLDRAIAAEPTDYRLLVVRGDAHARLRHWHEAAHDYERATTLAPAEIMNWYRSAALALAASDDNRWYLIYRTMMDRFGESRAVDVVGKIARICLIRPATAAGGKGTYRAIADLLSTAGAANYRGHWLCNLALADHRAGDHAHALELLGQTRKTPTFAAEPSLQALVSVVEALCQDGLGRREPALNALHVAEALLRANLWQHALPLAATWHDSLLAEVLYREAEARIVYDPICPADPFVPSSAEHLGDIRRSP
jgi:serine/threonine protein kinase/WD40 repeat protein